MNTEKKYIGLSSYEFLSKSHSFHSGVDGKEYVLKKISIDQLQEKIDDPAFDGFFIGLDVVVGDKKEIRVPGNISFYYCRFSYEADSSQGMITFKITSNQKDQTEVLFRECIFCISVIVSGRGSLNLKLDVFCASSNFRLCPIGDFDLISMIGGFKEQPLSFDAHGLKVQKVYVRGCELKVRLLGSSIKRFILRNSIITQIISAELDSLESFDVDTSTLKDSCVKTEPLPFKPGDTEDSYIKKGWKIFEDALPSHKKQQVEYISYLSGLNRYRTKNWKIDWSQKSKLWTRYICLKNFSSFYRILGLNVFFILNYAFLYLIIHDVVPSQSLKGTNDFLGYLYFSVITYTTTGYGDISPNGILRIIAGIEAFHGVVMVILTGFVFQRWITDQTISIDNPSKKK